MGDLTCLFLRQFVPLNTVFFKPCSKMACVDGGYLTFELHKQKNPNSVDYNDIIFKPTTNEGAMVKAAANHDDNTYEEPPSKK